MRGRRMRQKLKERRNFGFWVLPSTKFCVQQFKFKWRFRVGIPMRTLLLKMQIMSDEKIGRKWRQIKQEKREKKKEMDRGPETRQGLHRSSVSFSPLLLGLMRWPSIDGEEMRWRLGEEVSPRERRVMITEGRVKVALRRERWSVDELMRLSSVRFTKECDGSLAISSFHPSTIDRGGRNERLTNRKTRLSVPTSEEPKMLSARHRTTKGNHIVQVDVDRINRYELGELRADLETNDFADKGSGSS